VLGLNQFIDQCGGRRKAHAASLATGRDTQAGQQMGLARATVADQDDRFGARNVVAVSERPDLGGRDLGRLAEVKLIERLQSRQMRLLQAPRDRMALTLVDFGREQRVQIPEMRVPLAHRLGAERTTLVRDGREVQHLAMLPDRRFVERERRAHWPAARGSSESYSATLGRARW
jgi:hypothetical protein